MRFGIFQAMAIRRGRAATQAAFAKILARYFWDVARHEGSGTAEILYQAHALEQALRSDGDVHGAHGVAMAVRIIERYRDMERVYWQSGGR